MGAFCLRAERNMTLKKYQTKLNYFRIFLSILAASVCILFGCEKKQTVYLTQSETEDPLCAQEQEAEPQTGKEPAFETDEDTGRDQAESRIIVHICGAVVNPGVYSLACGSRIYQAIEEAGGFTGQADPDYLNQAESLQDGVKLYVPTREETAQGFLKMERQGISLQAQEQTGLVNINTAGEKELCTLAGIGSSKAKSIIAYREANGTYDRIEDIMKVEGIKEGLFAKIRDDITV